MKGIRMVLAWSLRTRWRSLLLLATLIALTGGATLAAWAGARRTSSAFGRMITATNSFDYAVASGSQTGQVDLAPGALAHLPGVVHDQAGLVPEWAQATSAGVALTNANALLLAVSGTAHAGDLQPRIIAGRAPNPAAADEVLANYQMSQTSGIHPGSVVTVQFYAPADAAQAQSGATATGPMLTFHVTGIGVSTLALQSGQPFGVLLLTPAFSATEGSQILSAHGDLLRLAPRPGAQAGFESALAHLPGVAPDLSNVSVIPAEGFNAQVQASIHPQAEGWLILAAFTALAGVVMTGQAWRRQAAAAAEPLRWVRALGMTSGDLAIVGAAQALVTACAGAAAAVVIAYALSPVSPIGAARVAEPSPGLRFDPVALLAGGGAVMVSALVLGTLASWYGTRRGRQGWEGAGVPALARPSRIVGWLGRAGAPAPALIGSRYALERGDGRGSVASGTAVLGTTVAAAAVVAAAVFGASLAHLFAHPALYGNDFTLQGGPQGNGSGPPDALDHLVGLVEALPGFQKLSLGTSGEVQVGNLSIPAIAVDAVRGPVAVTISAGRAPSGLDEVALGATTMRQLHAHLGSVIPVSAGGGAAARMRVVGTAVLPVTAGAGNGGLGVGLDMTVSALKALACPAGPQPQDCQVTTQAVLVGFAPDRAGAAGLAQALNANGPLAPLGFVTPYSPTTLVNFGQAINFPLLVAAIVVLFGAASLGHLLVVGLSRRHLEVGTLKSIGFVRRQVAAMVGWQAATVMAVALLVGIPLGIIAGRAVWAAFAGYFGVEAVTVVPWLQLVAIVGGGLVLSQVIAAGPGMLAARRSPVALLRTNE